MAMVIAIAVRPIGAITAAVAVREGGTGVQAIAMTERWAIAARLLVDGVAGPMMGMGGLAAGKDVRVVPARVGAHRVHVRRVGTMATVAATATTAGRAGTVTAAITDGSA
ncbi:hypothetical protein [Pinirhizobacter sp.]|jgi:hypothetical protein|uniref:hypothetical protein n=1 Tax=Pinirhizobacter sp. TaxID=2950432 RepID=UPI002F4192A6